MTTSPGKLNERITFQYYGEGSDGGGGTLKDWFIIPATPTVWARVIAKAGQEGIVSDRVTATMVTLFHIRNRSDLDETMRIVWRGSNFNIRGIRREGHQSQYLTIEAIRGSAT